MSIRFKCPVCGYRIKAPDGSYGRRGTCPRCKLMIRLPDAAEVDEPKEEDARPGQPPEEPLGGEEGRNEPSPELEDPALELD